MADGRKQQHWPGKGRRSARAGVDTISGSIGGHNADKESTLPESGVSGGGESSADSDISTGAALGTNKMPEDDKGDLAADPNRIARNLKRYRDEMAEDAPASGTRAGRE